jgi:hypothetical protein
MRKRVGTVAVSAGELSTSECDEEWWPARATTVGKTGEEIRSLLFRRNRDWLQS